MAFSCTGFIVIRNLDRSMPMRRTVSATIALMDDAGTPGLMSIPYLGLCLGGGSDLSEYTPFCPEQGKSVLLRRQAAKGIGSPHTPEDYIWHMALSMQGLTRRLTRKSWR